MLMCCCDYATAPFGLNQKLQAWEPKDKSKQISRFWDTLIPQGTYATTDASIKGLCQIMKEATPTAREALQRYVRRIAFTWDMEDRVSDPVPTHTHTHTHTQRTVIAHRSSCVWRIA